MCFNVTCARNTFICDRMIEFIPTKCVPERIFMIHFTLATLMDRIHKTLRRSMFGKVSLRGPVVLFLILTQSENSIITATWSFEINF